VAVRALSLLVIAPWVASRHHRLVGVLGRHDDAVHYVRIAEQGYTTANLAFFPLFPALIRAANPFPLTTSTHAIAIAWIASVIAAAGIFKVGSLVAGNRVGLMLVILWAVLPHAIVESMAYTEGLFTALAAWSLYFALRERWLLAGLVCFAAGLTRPTAIALIVALAFGAGVAVVRQRDWKALLAPALGAVGWIGYLAYVASRLHRADGWFWVQSTRWGSRVDGGSYDYQEFRHILEGSGSPVLYVVAAVVIGAVLLLLLSISSRQPLMLIVYSAGVLALTLASDTGFNKGRLLLPAFALLLPPATALAKARLRESVVILGFAGAASAWFGGYLLLIWHWSP
ncbi:MAG: hypothetical protein ACTHOG_10315, partial [Marmoricola sp.]